MPVGDLLLRNFVGIATVFMLSYAMPASTKLKFSSSTSVSLTNANAKFGMLALWQASAFLQRTLLFLLQAQLPLVSVRSDSVSVDLGGGGGGASDCGTA